MPLLCRGLGDPQTPDGSHLHSENEQRDIVLPVGSRGRRSGIEELYNAVLPRRSVFHHRRRGAAILAVCLAILGSAARRK